MFAEPQTPGEWFQEAARSYIEKHQGCPWCRGAYRVYRSERSQLLEYHCGGCDFFACHDQQTGKYFMGPGRRSLGALTMVAD